jgi:hypothetical protein
MDAQERAKKSRITSAATAAAPATGSPTTTAINPDLVALRTTADLIIRDLGFNGKGEITFELRNRGEVPINPAPVSLSDGRTAKRQVAPPVPENEQIRVTVYLNDAPFTTVFQPRLAGSSSKTFTVLVPDQKRPGCAESRPLRTVIDPTNVIVELTDTNNVDALTAVRPCPDLAVKSITKNTNEWKTEFVARVTLINNGNAPAERFDYLAKESFGGHIFDLGDLDDDVGGPLAPGETMKFNVGSALAHQNMDVEVLLDRHGRVEELNESNNYTHKKIN